MNNKVLMQFDVTVTAPTPPTVAELVAIEERLEQVIEQAIRDYATKIVLRNVKASVKHLGTEDA